MVLQYKCPNCGADMVYDSTSGTLACESCGRKDDIESFQRENQKSGGRSSGSGSQHDSGRDTVEYQCENCGAVLITDADTTATTCSFCGSGVIIIDRLSGDMAPAKVIPFKINRQEAEEMFRKWTKKSPLTPKKFHSANRIKELVGMYVPYWLFDVNAQGSAVANCTRVSSYSRGDYDYTETKHYHVSRTVNLNYLKVPTDASAKMDDRLMDRLEPYHYGDLKDFKTPYLSGYIAEKYNYDDKQMFPRVKDRVVGYTNKYIRDSIQGYTSVTITNSNINASQNNAHYTLLPVWMFIYDHDKRDYMFAMNGQTGKIVGKPPLSFAKSVLWFFGISGISFVTLQLISMIGGIF